MSIFREIPPTAGWPIYTADILYAFAGSNKQSLEEDFKKYLGRPYAKLTYSGTAALYLILEGLKELSAKRTIIIPSFVCPLVPLAALKAGLKIVACDIGKDNFDYDYIQLQNICGENNDMLAIIAVHLAGIPVDVDKINQIAREKNIFIIEDCAQALGTVYQGRKTGTLADFSFFSFCRGKGLTIYEGGLITANKEEYYKPINNAIQRLVENQPLSETLKIFELLGYWLFYRPQLFWFVFRMPQIFWELQKQQLRAATEFYTTDFPIHKVSKLRNILGHSSFHRIEKQINQQRLKASYYINNLKDTAGIRLITELEGSKANYPYLTLVFEDISLCRKAKDIFRNSGLGVSQVYVQAILDYGYLKDKLSFSSCQNARWLAKNHITLSTSQFLENRSLSRIIRIIKSLF